MDTSVINEAKYFRAVKRIKIIKAFYLNVTVYCTIIPILIYINLKYSPHYYWFWFSALGWGVGLLSHAFQAFEWYKIFLSKDWEDRKIKELMIKDMQNGK